MIVGRCSMLNAWPVCHQMEDDVDMELELERQMEREQQLDNIKQVQKLVSASHFLISIHLGHCRGTHDGITQDTPLREALWHLMVIV